MCVRPSAVTNNLRAHQSLESVHHLNRDRVRCMSSTPRDWSGTDRWRCSWPEAGWWAGGPARLARFADHPVSASQSRDACPAVSPRRVPRSRCGGHVRFQARQRGRGAVPSSARPVCGLPGGLAQDSTSAISRRSPATTSVPSTEAAPRDDLASVRRHAPGRLDQAAVQPPSGPSNPARRPWRPWPARALLSVPASSPTGL